MHYMKPHKHKNAPQPIWSTRETKLILAVQYLVNFRFLTYVCKREGDDEEADEKLVADFKWFDNGVNE